MHGHGNQFAIDLQFFRRHGHDYDPNGARLWLVRRDERRMDCDTGLDDRPRRDDSAVLGHAKFSAVAAQRDAGDRTDPG